MNAKFWIFINDSWVRITLRPGETLHYSKVSRHDEGWNCEAAEWRYEGENIYASYYSDGTDCARRFAASMFFAQ